jgi:hypothetical protein
VTDLEQRLRRDLKDLSQRVGPDSIRPLRVPGVRRRSRVVRWLAPVTAVAAVIGVVIGVSVAGRGPSGTLISPPATSPESAGTMPLYYVTAYQSFTGGSNGEPATFAAVHDSATGATLTTVHMPTLTGYQGGTQGPSITAAGDDRTFIITESAQVAAGSATRTITHRLPPTPRFPHGRTVTTHVPAAMRNVTKFYLLRVAANGRSARLGLLPVSIGSLSMDDVALSPDGSKLAVAAQSCQSANHCQFSGIRVITLATRAAANWTTQESGAVWNLSWAGDDYLAFQWEGVSTPGGQAYRLLDVAGTGGNLMAGPAIASPAPITADSGYTPPALITGDGRAVITTAISDIPEGNGRDTVIAKVVELSAGTGQLLKVLYTVTEHQVSTGQNAATNVSDLDQGCQVLSLGPTGVQPLVECYAFGRVENGKLTPLAGFPSPSTSGIAGQNAAAW